MYDKYKATDHSHFHTVVNTFTEGLRELPTDYVARVKSFLTEYLGSPQQPVPFGGRSRDFEDLDTWLADSEAAPYLLLAAPAGRGKSALLVRWCQQLFARRDLAVAYFPVSIRFRTNLAGISFPSLVALLARLHGEKVPTDPNMQEEVWRGLFIDYINRPLPSGRSLVLVLDGIDEAADWIAGPDLFPLNPTPGLRVVLSARYLANDQDADAWLKRLGWMRPGLARTLELYPLDRTGIASVLVQMGFPLDILGTRIDIVSELYRLSEGDPLLVRLYVDDLWKRGDAARRFQPEDLRAIRPGLVGYFERWWKEQRLLWSNDAPQREAAAQVVLNVLAGALGPLSKKDILSLIPEEVGLTPTDLEQHLAPLARFVTGDGVHQGYVFSHPRLGNYFFEERLSEIERQEIEHRFLTWGEQTLTALNEERLTPENASAYIVQYYGAHLEHAQADANTLLTLVNNGWRRAWEKLDRANAGFLGDVEMAWQAAEQKDTVATASNDQASYLGEEIRCLLCQVSINSMTSNISPRLMLEAVKTSVWTPAQGLASIRLITDLAPRARELVELAPYVQEPLRTNILQEALDTVMTIKDEYARLDALIELSSHFSEELLWPILEFVPTVEDEADRAEVLAELAPALAPYKRLLEKALDFVQELEEEEYRALALEGLAPYFSEELYERARQLVRTIGEERYRAQTLIALTPHVAESNLQEILQEGRSMQDGLSQIRLLTKLVTYLPEQLRAETIQEVLELEQDIEDREYRVEVLTGLTPYLSEEELQRALQEIQLIWDESYRASALNQLVQYMPEELLPKVLRVAQAMKSEECRTKVLTQLIPHLSKELLTQALDTIQATWDEGCKAELLAQIAPYATEDLLPRLLEIVATITDKGYRVWLLAELETSLAGKISGDFFNIGKAFQEMREKEERLQTLLAILPRLSEGALSKIFSFMLPEVFRFSWHVRPEENRAHILTKFGSRLPESMLPATIEMVREIRNEAYQVQILLILAPRIHGNLLSAVVDIVRGMKDKDKRAQVLVALVSSLPEEEKDKKIQEMLQVLQIIKDETQRTHVVVTSAPYLSTTLSSPKAEMALAAVQACTYEKNKVDMLKVLVPHLPDVRIEAVLEIARQLKDEEEQAQVLETLAPHLPERLFPDMLNMVDALQNERWRLQVLTTMASYAPQDIIMDMLENVHRLPSEHRRGEVLRALIPSAPKSSFAQLWYDTETIFDEGIRVLVLEKFALHMPEEFFPLLWKAIQGISSEGWQMWILRALTPHMSEDLFDQIWKVIQATRNEEKRALMLLTLAPNVPERAFSRVWKATRAIHNQRMRWQILQALAPNVPKEFISEFFMIARIISSEGIRVQVLLPLIPHTPESLFSPLWETTQAIQNQRLQLKMLVELASHAPNHLLPDVWEAIRTMGDLVAQLQGLKTLAPQLSQDKLIETVNMIQNQSHGEWRVEIIEVILPYLSEEKRREMQEELVTLEPKEQLVEIFAHTMQHTRWHIRTLAILVPYLPQERLLAIAPALLEAIQTLKVEEEKVWFLRKLASNVPEELLVDLFEALWSLTITHNQTQILEALCTTLSQTGWVKVLELTVTRMKATGEMGFAVQVLKAAGSFVQQSTPSLLYPALREILHLLAQYTRRDTLINLAQMMAAIYVVGGEEAVLGSCSATLEVGCWWP